MKRGRRTLVKFFKLVPKPLVWRFAKGYIAGARLEDAVRTVRALNGEGCRATVDVLGEDVADEREVQGFVDAYRRTIEAIVREGLDANVSIKPSAMGLKIDPALALRAAGDVVRAAGKHGMFVRIDMEDSSTVDATFDLYARLRAEGNENVGVVLQAMLRRTLADAARLAAEGANVRLVKGIYVEPRPVAFGEFDAVRQSYARLAELLLAAPRGYTAIATHDEWLTVEARHAAARLGAGRDRFEFQMLLGVDPLLRRTLVAEGYGMRVYVPFGAGWHGYSIRRLVENPRVAGHVARAALGLGPKKE